MRETPDRIVITNALATDLRESADFLEHHVDECDPAYLASVADCMRQAADALDATCAWTLDDTYGNKWDTSCSEAYEFLTDGPVENKQAFCGYCGKRLVVVPPAPSTGPRD